MNFTLCYIVAGLLLVGMALAGTLLAAMFGGKVGERYHKRVDRAGYVD